MDSHSEPGWAAHARVHGLAAGVTDTNGSLALPTYKVQIVDTNLESMSWSEFIKSLKNTGRAGIILDQERQYIELGVLYYWLAW